jgi:hypothetical protein
MSVGVSSDSGLISNHPGERVFLDLKNIKGRYGLKKKKKKKKVEEWELQLM